MLINGPKLRPQCGYRSQWWSLAVRQVADCRQNDPGKDHPRTKPCHDAVEACSLGATQARASALSACSRQHLCDLPGRTPNCRCAFRAIDIGLSRRCRGWHRKSRSRPAIGRAAAGRSWLRSPLRRTPSSLRRRDVGAAEGSLCPPVDPRAYP